MFEFFTESNRWKHLLYCYILALLTLNPTYAIYVAAVAGGCLEFKDYQHGCTWDWIDFLFSVLGGVLAAITQIIFKLIFKID